MYCRGSLTRRIRGAIPDLGSIVYLRISAGSGLREVSATRPARKREYAAAAIIAALSVESARLGKNTSMPDDTARFSNAARRSLLAATPPDTSMESADIVPAAAMVCSNRVLTTDL